MKIIQIIFDFIGTVTLIGLFLASFMQFFAIVQFLSIFVLGPVLGLILFFLVTPLMAYALSRGISLLANANIDQSVEMILFLVTLFVYSWAAIFAWQWFVVSFINFTILSVVTVFAGIFIIPVIGLAMTLWIVGDGSRIKVYGITGALYYFGMFMVTAILWLLSPFISS